MWLGVVADLYFLACGKLRQEDCLEFEAYLGYVMSQKLKLPEVSYPTHLNEEEVACLPEFSRVNI